MRGSGLSKVGAVWFTVVITLLWPIMALAEWAVSEEKGFGKFKD